VLIYGSSVHKKEERVPKVEVVGVGSFEVPEGKRLVLAIEEDAGWTSCTTSVRDRKIDGGFRFRAVLSEHGTQLELMKGVAGA